MDRMRAPSRPVKTVLTLAMGLMGLAACHSGGDGNRSGVLTASEQKYCTLVKQFKTPTFPKDPEPDQFAAIMTEYVAKNSKYFEAAPEGDSGRDQARRGEGDLDPAAVATGDITAYDGLNLEKADQWEGTTATSRTLKRWSCHRRR